MKKRKGKKERWKCGCLIDHDAELFTPCTAHAAIIAARMFKDMMNAAGKAGIVEIDSTVQNPDGSIKTEAQLFQEAFAEACKRGKDSLEKRKRDCRLDEGQASPL